MTTRNEPPLFQLGNEVRRRHEHTPDNLLGLMLGRPVPHHFIHAGKPDDVRRVVARFEQEPGLDSFDPDLLRELPPGGMFVRLA